MPPPSTQPTDDTRDLLPGQQLILDAGFLASGQSWLLEMPTGSGKTWLSEQAIAAVLQQGRRAVYLAPIKALTQRQYADWCYRFGADQVGLLDGDHAVTSEVIADVRLLVATPESLESCLRQPQAHLNWVRQLSLVVVDEIDLLHDGWRGARLEGVLVQLQLLNPLLRVIGITATLGDERDLRTWLGAAFVRTTHRAVPLHWQQIRFWNTTEKQQRTIQYLLNAVQNEHQCLVFCQSRQRTEVLGKALLAHNIPTVWHHAGLDPVDRTAAESDFQSGKASVLCATTTLAMGVNLPAREVIIYDTQRPDGNGAFVPLPRRELTQMAGRAGRPGYDDQGTVTLLIHEKEVTQWQDRPRTVLAPVRSALADPVLLTERVLTAINGQYAQTKNQLERFLSRTLAYQQGLLPDVPQLLEHMQATGLITEANGQYSTTSLSEVAVRCYLQPETASHFQRLLPVTPLWCFDLLLVVCSAPDFTATSLLPVRQEQVSQSEACLATVNTQLLQSTQTLTSHLRLPPDVLVKVVYTTCALHIWTQCGEVSETARLLDCAYTQDLLKAINNAQRLLEALLALCTITTFPVDNTTTPARLAALQDMVAHGLTTDEVTLLSVPGVCPAQVKQLIRAGIGSAAALAKASPQVVSTLPGFGVKTSKRAVAYARAVVKQLPDLTESGDSAHRQQAVQTLRRLWIQSQTNWQRS